jgi:hypothetical protein
MLSRSHDDKSRMDAPMKPKLSGKRTVTLEPEEHDALMAELPAPEIEPQSFTKIAKTSEINEKFRKIEFYMMIIVGLVLLVLILCKAN